MSRSIDERLSTYIAIFSHRELFGVIYDYRFMRFVFTQSYMLLYPVALNKSAFIKFRRPIKINEESDIGYKEVVEYINTYLPDKATDVSWLMAAQRVGNALLVAHWLGWWLNGYSTPYPAVELDRLSYMIG